MAELETRQGDMWGILPLVAGTETLRMLQDGDVNAGVIACSQSIGLVTEVKPVAKVISGMVHEAAEIRDRIGG